MIRFSLAAVLALLAFAVAPVTQAQQTGAEEVHRLEIREGRVYHNGVEIPAPEGVDIEGLTFTFEYSGPGMPALTLNGRVYTLEGDRLMVLEDVADPANSMAVVAASSAEEGRRQAEEAYLATLSERDRALYTRLLHEREMEIDALRLAYRYRHLSSVNERPQLRRQLHQLLSTMFDLKQENRREEIRQVEDMLEIMRRQVEEREEQRDELIRQRLDQLTDEP
jgi:hypothetical protein